jgi:hypothetical protein
LNGGVTLWMGDLAGSAFANGRDPRGLCRWIGWFAGSADADETTPACIVGVNAGTSALVHLIG